HLFFGRLVTTSHQHSRDGNGDERRTGRSFHFVEVSLRFDVMRPIALPLL
ncbi:MAG: hypothetical protein RL321_1802, partial [Pseudomonadota bacterium]